MDTLNFKIQGSASDPYIITFTKEGNNLKAFCDCPAGQNWKHCKHRVGLLTGSTKGLVSDNSNELVTLQGMMEGTDLEVALGEYLKADEASTEAKKQLTKTKKVLVQAMHK